MIDAETDESWDKYHWLASNILVSDPDLHQDLEKPQWPSILFVLDSQ